MNSTKPQRQAILDHLSDHNGEVCEAEGTCPTSTLSQADALVKTLIKDVEDLTAVIRKEKPISEIL